MLYLINYSILIPFLFHSYSILIQFTKSETYQTDLDLVKCKANSIKLNNYFHFLLLYALGRRYR